MTPLLLGLIGLTTPSALATSSAGTGELLSTMETAPPNVIFVVDLSPDMALPCSSSTTTRCIDDVLTAVDQVTRHFDWARYGVVGTSAVATSSTFTRIAPVGSSYNEISAATASLRASWTSTAYPTRNISEVLESLSDSYLDLASADNGVDNDSDGMTGDWAESPIQYNCQNTHIIVLSRDRGYEDDGVTFSFRAGVSGDVMCDAAGTVGTTTADTHCAFDNVAAHIYNRDHSGLSGTQRAITHGVLLGSWASTSIPYRLFANIPTATSTDGLFATAAGGTAIQTAILSVLGDIQAGIYSRSTPVVTVDGRYLISTFYELTGDNPLPQGHIRAYNLDPLPTSPTYGQIIYDGPSMYGGAQWDGGDLLVSRLVVSRESNPEDRDGIGQRDIYTWERNAYDYVGAMRTEANATRRMGLDYEFVTNLGYSSSCLAGTCSAACPLACYMDTRYSSSSSCATDPSYDLNRDCTVNLSDMYYMVDFVRGLPTARFRYIDMARGTWKLADSPYSIPAVVTPRNNAYSTDPTYRAFLAGLEADNVPAIVLLAANDGMLHAFRLEDDAATSTSNEAGQELWAWVPGYLLKRGKSEEWANDLIDLALFGKTFLFDGSPQVEDVWIDENGDGDKDCTSPPYNCEWHRVLVVQQGLGGPATIALDITDTQSPEFLWEHINTTDYSAMGATMGKPTIFNVYDAEDSSDQRDRWVAMWGGGRAVASTGSTTANSYYKSTEANLYMWAMEDDCCGWYDSSSTNNYAVTGDNIGTKHPGVLVDGRGSSTFQYTAPSATTDSNLEYAYISSALAVVDVDNDGDGDVAYFPVTTAYLPYDRGGTVANVENPGNSYVYKAIIDTTHPDDLTWSLFYDPYEGTDGTNGVSARPEVFYAATTAWLPDGNLGIFWGSGTPFDRETVSSRGYFFAMYDTDPTDPSSSAQPIGCDGNDGYYPLHYGEGLTASPLVYAGTVYFTTYQPATDSSSRLDRCTAGTGRVYGLDFDTCAPALDSDGDGSADTSSISQSGYVSGVTVSAYGTVYYGTATPRGGTSMESGIETNSSLSDPFLGTRALAWMEVY